jgi:hypothetical protein
MSALQALIRKAQESRDVQERLYGPFPIGIAHECGAAEVLDIAQTLDRLEAEKAAMES